MNRGRHKKSKKSTVSKEAVLIRISSIITDLFYHYNLVINKGKRLDIQESYISVCYSNKNANYDTCIYAEYIINIYYKFRAIDTISNFIKQLDTPTKISIRYGYKKDNFQINI